MIESLIALLTLTSMEIVLGIDNIVFISIVVSRLREAEREKARKLGIALALILRLGLLFSISWVMSLKDPLFEIFNHSISGRDIILLVGGLFLIGKSTLEIHHKIEDHNDLQKSGATEIKNYAEFSSTLLQILMLDVVFSLDSVITAVGMAQQIWVMVVAMVLSVIIMLMAAKSVGNFVDQHPTIKILALSFLILIGTMLLAEGLSFHMDKGYIYFAMFFSLVVEMINLRLRKKH